MWNSQCCTISLKFPNFFQIVINYIVLIKACIISRISEGGTAMINVSEVVQWRILKGVCEGIQLLWLALFQIWHEAGLRKYIVITKVSKEINLLQFYCYQFVSVVFLECSLLFTNSSSSELQVSDPSLACCIPLWQTQARRG